MNERDEIERGQGAERSALPVPPKNQLNRKVFLNNDKTQQVLKVLLLTKFDGIPLEDYFLSVIITTNSHYYEFKTNSQYEKWTELRETRDWTQVEK